MDLDKKMSLLKKDFAKKQVEIKEVALKKPSSNSDPSPLVFRSRAFLFIYFSGLDHFLLCTSSEMCFQV